MNGFEKVFVTNGTSQTPEKAVYITNGTAIPPREAVFMSNFEDLRALGFRG